MSSSSTAAAVTTASCFPPAEIRDTLNEVVRLLHERKETVSVAETASGGLISASLLSTPGASKIYRGGLTLYTLESRVSYAGWTQAMTDSYRGPTPEVVSFLAENVRGRLGSTYTICESGTAGPTGGNTRNRTPGYVALAVAREGEVSTDEIETGSADRERNMVDFTHGALKLLLKVLEGKGQKL